MSEPLPLTALEWDREPSEAKAGNKYYHPTETHISDINIQSVCRNLPVFEYGSHVTVIRCLLTEDKTAYLRWLLSSASWKPE